jgi:hypothetical protein
MERKPRDTLVLAVRVPIPFAKSIYAAAGGQDRFAEWARALFQAAVAGKAPGVGTLQAQGYQEGRRQGWAAGNRLYLKVVTQVATELKG